MQSKPTSGSCSEVIFGNWAFQLGQSIGEQQEMKLERPRPLGQTGMKQTGRPERVWGGGPSLVPVCPWVSPDQVQVVLSPMAGPETILRAATHGLLLGALRGDGPLPEELDKLRNRVWAGKCLTV